MIDRFAVRLVLLLLSGSLLPSFAADNSSPADTSLRSTNTFHPLSPGPVDGEIALVTAKMLEEYHYLRQPFNASVSAKFLDRYIETFDPQHLHFLQSDLAEFDHYRTNLDHLTIPVRGRPDTHAATEVFNRFVERLEQRVAYADELLRTEKFTFDTDERVVLNRKEMPYPKDLDDAKKLWRERLRAEYLQELLGKIDARKNAKEKGEAPAAVGAGTNATQVAAAPKPPKTDQEEIVDTLTRRYHRNLHTFIDWDSDDVLQIYLTALAHVYDPHSDYMGHAQLESFAIGMNLSLFGIGAELTTEDGYCTIHRLLPGGPAEKSKKIHENDRIIAVAQSNQPPVDVVDMSLNKAVQLIRGPKGTEVRLTIVPAGGNSSARVDLALTRDEIKLEDQEAKAKLIELPGVRGESLRLGVIDLPSFYASFDPSNSRGKAEPKSTTEDVTRLLTKLKKEHVGGVILDLRRNGGGSLEEAIRLTGLFIKDGPVVQVRSSPSPLNPQGKIEVDEDPDSGVLYDGPLIVLTSRFSASASEILAGALQDYGRALIVGDSSTHGKGTVQSVQPLRPLLPLSRSIMTNDPGALKLTIKKFYRPSGASTQKKGVVPDVILPSIFNESKDIGESALENPLAWDTIPSAKYDRLNMVDPYLPELRKRSTERLQSDKEYAYIREDIELFKKQQADKTVSLNEQQRLKEKDEAEARQKAREKERRERPPSAEKVYELSLKQAMLPGLPPPDSKSNTLAKVNLPKEAIAAGGLTNSPVAAAQPAQPKSNDDGLDGEGDEPKPTAPDEPLVESERILVDYLSLLPKGSVASTASHPE